MPPTAVEVVTQKMDEVYGALSERIKANDEAIKQLTETGAVTDELKSQINALENKYGSIEDMQGEWATLRERQDKLEAASKRTGVQGADGDEGPEKPYKSLGEQMRDVWIAGHPDHRSIDPKLKKVNEIYGTKAATGMGETIPSDGGFLVQTDYSTDLLRRTYNVGQIMQRVRRMQISSGANGLKIPYINETSRATGSRMGGVRVYWPAEGAEKTASKPSLGQHELTLHKAVALVYASDELMEDAPALESLITEMFPEEMAFSIEDKFYRGTGAGCPLGILNSGATVTVAKEAGQAAATITYTNIVKMWSRLWARSMPNAVWMINQDCFPQLAQMSLAVGTGGVPVYMPANGAADAPYGTLMGRPVLISEYCATLGTVGDIALVDWSTYLSIDKGGLKTASSMHVRFIYDETAFRFVQRIDGQPTWSSALTPYQGTNTVSPVIVLATRA